MEANCRSIISCDTFVALPPASKSTVIFGKNSDRPCGEAQEVVYFQGGVFQKRQTLKCTYIEIEQVQKTYSVILSKPSWMWGAEMGANEKNVCIGNEAVWTHLNGPDDSVERLLGMDLVRLGLERAGTAREAVDVMTSLLEMYGQGGPCSDDGSKWSYHNSFLIADPREAWVLETAGTLWAAEQVTSGVRNISNGLTIRTKIDAHSADLKQRAVELRLLSEDDRDPIDFAKTFASGFDESEFKTSSKNLPCGRQAWGRKLLEDRSAKGNFSPNDMFEILRHEESGICMDGVGFVSAGSQVSELSTDKPSRHFFSALPNPKKTFFKPFVFCEKVELGTDTKSPVIESDPAKCSPRFSVQVNRNYPLLDHHQKFWASRRKSQSADVSATLDKLEKRFVSEVENGDRDALRDIFSRAVGEEVALYNAP